MNGELQGDRALVNLRNAQVAGGNLGGALEWKDVRTRFVVPDRIALQFKGVRLESIPLPEFEGRARGAATGRLAFETKQRVNEAPQWSSSAEVSIEQLVLDQLEVGDTAVTWRKELDSQTVLANLKIDKASGRASAEFEVQLADQDTLPTSDFKIAKYHAVGNLVDYATVVQVPSVGSVFH